MNFSKTCFLLLLLSNKSISQSGTLIFAGIGTDGIVIASDSRVTYADSSKSRQHYVAYADSVTKIYRVRGYPVGMSGYNSWGKKTIFQLIDDFNKLNQRLNRIDSVLKQFQRYIFNTNRESINAGNMKGNIFIGAGYIEGKPIIIRFTISTFEIYRSGIACSDSGFTSWFSKNFNEALTSDQLSEFFEWQINHYSKDSVFGNIDIGGPVQIVKVTPQQKIFSFRNDFTALTLKESNFSVLKNDIIQQRRKITYLVPDGQNRLFALLDFLSSLQ